MASQSSAELARTGAQKRQAHPGPGEPLLCTWMADSPGEALLPPGDGGSQGLVNWAAPGAGADLKGLLERIIRQ